VYGEEFHVEYFFQGLGVCVGVVVGTVITIAAQRWSRWQSEKQQKFNLKFELELNIGKIDSWLEELGCYRDAVNGDSLHTYFGYFNLGSILMVTTSAMLQSGLLYKILSHEQIGQLQAIFSEFSTPTEQYMYNQMNQTRSFLEICRSNDQFGDWTKLGKPAAFNNILFWESKFRNHKKNLEEIVASIR
jgi:hypothetical protein